MLFYFTGTGNSLYVAKQIEEHPISIPQEMKKDNVTYKAESIGIVSPVYGHEVPPIVKEFLKENTFDTDYFYMVLTYGKRHGGAAELADNLCRACGIAVDYINVIVMVDNWLPIFDMEEQVVIEKNVDKNLAEIIADIKCKKHMIAEVTDADRDAHCEFLENMKKMPVNSWQHLIKIKDNCVGCDICEKVCPSASIRIESGKAMYSSGNCQACLACVHACPQKAIGLSIQEKNPNARYRNEHIQLKEIIEANNQHE